MPIKERGTSLLRRFKDDEGGNIALTFAVSAVAIIGCMGAAMDFSTLSSAEARSQSIADQTALAAAIFVKTNGREPNPPQPVADGQTQEQEEGYLDSSYKTYTADELGYEFKGWVDGGASNVNVTVDYDGVEKEARVKVTGKTVPTFMQIFGHKSLEFVAESTAKYEDFEFYDPASVLLVLDNSGSMSFDDKPLVENVLTGDMEPQDGAQRRIDALKGHSSAFMTSLQNLVGNQSNDDDKVLRTGMLAYNSNTISSRTVQMGWQTASTKASIDLMGASGGTNSAPPIDTARIWMSGEDDEHTDMHGEDPIKFVVFMTDGINTQGGSTWVEEDDTGQWYGVVCTKWGYWGCRRASWDTVEQENKPSYGWYWTEGKWEATANIQSVADCTAMKNDGVRIYTIGFALAAGEYDTNGYFGNNSTDTIDEDVRDKAYAFLTECASEPSTFLTAENSLQLNQAFTRIGNDIMTEIVRLSN